MSSHFIQVLFEGNDEFIRGFLQGYRIGKGISAHYFFHHDAGIQAETLSQKLKEWTTLSNKYHYVLLDQDFFNRLKESGSDSGLLADTGIKILSAKAVRSGTFSVKIKGASRAEASAIKKIVEEKPSDLQTRDWQEKETIDPDSKGVELYTPVHDYIFAAVGTFKGEIEALIAFRHHLSEHSAVTAKEIELEFAE